MKDFNLTAEGVALPEYSHIGNCNCADCEAVYAQRKAILAAEIKQQYSRMMKYTQGDSLPLNGKTISIAFVVAMAIFLFGLLNGC